MDPATPPHDPRKPECSLLLFLATPTEEDGLQKVVQARGLPFEPYSKKKSPLGGHHWLGRIGVIMGSIGRLGTAARGILSKALTGAQGIVQLGMAFGIDPNRQQPGDVLVSTSIIPYDNRDIEPAPDKPGE